MQIIRRYGYLPRPPVPSKGEAVKLFFFHLMPFADRRRNLEMFARKVIPRMRHLGECAPAGAAE